MRRIGKGAGGFALGALFKKIITEFEDRCVYRVTWLVIRTTPPSLSSFYSFTG